MKNVLIVDDNQQILDSLSSYLRFEPNNYNVLTAEDGGKAIEVLKSNPVSLILTDLEMPNVDGYQVIAYAKMNHPTVPVLIMTGSWSLELEMLVRKTGVVHCLVKPFRFQELGQIIADALGHGLKASSAIAPDQELMDKPPSFNGSVPERDNP